MGKYLRNKSFKTTAHYLERLSDEYFLPNVLSKQTDEEIESGEMFEENIRELK